MAPLRSLELEFPLVDSNFQQFCASHGILSVEDFLIHDLYLLVGSAEHETTSDRLKQGIAQVLSTIDGLHQPWLSGMELLEDAQQNKHILSTGCEGINVLLQGGLREGQVTELVGPSPSGKTQVCLLAASNIAKNYGGAVIFIDTGNSFSAKRIAEHVGKISDTAFKEPESQILEKIMSSILCHSVFDVFDLLSLLHQLESNLRSQMKTGSNRVLLVVVDSVSSLISPVLGSSGPYGRALMVSVGYLLKKLADENNIAVLVIYNIFFDIILQPWLKCSV